MNNKTTLAVTSTSLLAAGMAQGGIVYTNANVQLIADQNQPYMYPFDMDGTNGMDFIAGFDNHNGDKPFIDCKASSFGATTASTNGWTLSNLTGSGNDWGAPLTGFGTAVGDDYATVNPPKKTAYLYHDGGNNTVGDWPNNAKTDGYVGLALISDTATNYGYAHLIYDGTASPKTLKLVGYGYETEPGKIIITGAQVPPADPRVYELPAAVTVGAGDPAQFRVLALADPAPTYQWRAAAPGTGSYTNLINDGHFSGVDTPNLSVSTTTSADNLDLQVVISNVLGSTNTPPARLTVVSTVIEGPVPAIARIFPGQSATFDIAVSSGVPTGYQWRKGGANISDGVKYAGTTTSNLLITSLTGADAGSYDIVVNGLGGATTSASATLAIQPTDGGAFEAAVLAKGPKFYYRFNETIAAASGNVVAYDNGAGKNGVYGTNTQNGGSVASIAGPRPTDNFPGFHTTNAAMRTLKNSSTGVVKTAPWILNTDTVTISAWIKPASEPGAGDGIVCVRNTQSGNVCGMAYYGGLGQPAPYGLGYNWHDESHAFWWDSKIYPPLNEWSLVSLVVTPTNATVYMVNNNQLSKAVHDVPSGHVVQFTDAPGDNAVYIGGNSLSPTGGNNFDGTVDEVAVFTRALSEAEVLDLYLKASGIESLPPTITAQPVSERLFAGRTTRFHVTATPEPLTYTWMAGTGGVFTNLVNGGDVSGATSATLSIANVSAADLIDYQVVVTNAGGAVTSSVVTLSLVPLSGTAYETTLLEQGGLAAYYPLDEVEDPAVYALAFDPVGGFTGLYGTAVQNGNPAYGAMGPRPVDGLAGFSADNSGVLIAPVPNSRITLPAFNLNTNAVSLTAWIYPMSVPSAYAGIVFCRGGSGMVSGLDYSGTTNVLGERTLGYHWGDGFGTYNWDSGIVPPLNQWSFVALVIDPATGNATISLMNTSGATSASNFTTDNLAVQSFNAPTLIGLDTLGVPDRAFHGYIDSVGIYASALSPTDLESFYSAAVTGITPVRLGIQPVGNQVRVSWPRGTLLEASSVDGPWTTNGNTSPYLFTPAGPQKFFRVQVQ